MQLRVVADQPWDVKVDVLVIPIVGSPDLSGPLAELDRRAGGEIRALLEFGELKGKRFRTVISSAGEIGAKRLLLVLAGEAEDLDREAAVRIGASAVRRLAGREARKVAFWLAPLAERLDGGADAAAELVTRGVVEGAYDPAAIYRESMDEAPAEVGELVLVAPGEEAGRLAKLAERGRIIGEGTNHTRTLANRSANDVSPEVLAEEAWSLAEKHDLWIDVIGADQATEMGMGLFMAVGRGSDNPPRMIVMRSGRAGQRDALDRHLAIVGKGVCFDSGGISIKPSDRMDEMKMDKAGACAVIVAATTVARLAPGTPLLAIAPAVENMPGPHSTRPGDVVKALNGKRVDITNTDAEGRLILADAMTYAEQLGATHVVDVATLTGAVARALGELVSGAFGTPQSFVDEVFAAGRQAGERYWQLPLVEEYAADMRDSWYGDVVNFSRNNEGGLVKSAMFLREFVTKPWVHLDIAGTGYYRKVVPYAGRGATGVAHATLVELALAGAKT